MKRQSNKLKLGELDRSKCFTHRVKRKRRNFKAKKKRRKVKVKPKRKIK